MMMLNFPNLEAIKEKLRKPLVIGAIIMAVVVGIVLVWMIG